MRIHCPEGRAHRMTDAQALAHLHFSVDPPRLAMLRRNKKHRTLKMVRKPPDKLACFAALDAARARVAALPAAVRWEYECWAERLRHGAYAKGSENPLFLARANATCPRAAAQAPNFAARIGIANSEQVAPQ